MDTNKEKALDFLVINVSEWPTINEGDLDTIPTPRGWYWKNCAADGYFALVSAKNPNIWIGHDDWCSSKYGAVVEWQWWSYLLLVIALVGICVL